MDASSVMQVRRDAGVITVTLDRPDSLNALNAPLLASLRAALDNAASDSSVGAVVLAGAGRAFSSGADLREGAIPPPPASEVDGVKYLTDAVRNVMECARLLHQMPKPTIAMVRGVAAGAGLGLAAAC